MMDALSITFMAKKADVPPRSSTRYTLPMSPYPSRFSSLKLHRVSGASRDELAIWIASHRLSPPVCRRTCADAVVAVVLLPPPLLLSMLLLRGPLSRLLPLVPAASAAALLLPAIAVAAAIALPVGSELCGGGTVAVAWVTPPWFGLLLAAPAGWLVL
jgi:hypothetical protein